MRVEHNVNGVSTVFKLVTIAYCVVNTTIRSSFPNYRQSTQHARFWGLQAPSMSGVVLEVRGLYHDIWGGV